MKCPLPLRLQVQRYRLEGYSQRDTARILNKSRKFIQRWWLSDNLLRKPGSGRPIKISPKVIRRVSMRIQHRPRLSQRQLSSLERVPRTSIQRILKKLRLRPYRLRKTLFMSQQHRKNRVAFARNHQDDDWSRTFFVDEKIFVVLPQTNRQNTRFYATSRDQVPLDIQGTHSKKLNVIAGMSSSGTTPLFVFRENMTAEIYKRFLITSLLPKARQLFGGNWRLGHDNDRKHTSKLVTSFLAEKGVAVLDWPAKSPDLNPIENLWSVLDSNIARDPHMSLDTLEKTLKSEWRKIEPNLLQKLVDSVPARLRLVVKSKGQTISY